MIQGMNDSVNDIPKNSQSRITTKSEFQKQLVIEREVLVECNRSFLEIENWVNINQCQ
jgi:hypothetical protein